MLNVRGQADRLGNSEKAFYKLNSIAYLAEELGLDERTVRKQIDEVVRIALPYGFDEQLEVLRIIDDRYAEAIEESNSRLCLYVKDRSLCDPVQRLRERAEDSLQTNKVRLTVKGLDNVAEDALIGIKLSIQGKQRHVRRGGGTNSSS